MGRHDSKWIKSAQNGSKKAFGKLIEEYSDFIFHVLYDMTGNYDDAKDLTQDVFLKAYQNIKKYRGDAKFSTWIYRIAFNLGIDHSRRQKRIRQVNIDTKEREISTKGDMADILESQIGVGEAIETALQQLTDMQRMSVVLHHYQGLPLRDVSEVLGCSESTARVHLFRGLRNLRKLLKDYAPGEK